ncbi:MAG: response regulator [Thermodesulfovibrionales bacterium]|nr:response regulator [Thermodesulfovibrionales bacterium]
MNNLRIMIVDDSLIIIKKLTQIFESLGHKVVATARTGKEAIENFNPEKIDLVTMDITMPDMDGIEATKLIKEKAPTKPVLVITSHGQEQMIVRAIEAGASGYILKPFDVDKIAKNLEKILLNISKE